MSHGIGCWTCKVRRKKCDRDDGSACENCEILCIPCYRGGKPDWMDGARRQAGMAAMLKRKIRLHSHRRVDRGARPPADITTRNVQTLPDSHTSSLSDTPSKRDKDCSLLASLKDSSNLTPTADAILLSHFLETVLPFLLPLYRTDLSQEGGRAWILEFAGNSPVFRQVVRFQASSFDSIINGCTAEHRDATLTQRKDVFRVLRHAVSTVVAFGIQSHLRACVRILTSILQIQRFEVALMDFQNCKIHLDAAIGLFTEMLGGTDQALGNVSLQFDGIIMALGPSLPLLGRTVYNSEQAAFRLSTTLLLFDDVIASTASRTSPRLLDYHPALLGHADERGPLLQAENVVGCPNWILLVIGKAAALDAWKRECQRKRSLDTLELAQRVLRLQAELQARMTRNGPLTTTFEMRAATIFANRSAAETERQLVTSIWTHAVSLYLLVIASGRDPLNPRSREHVQQAVTLLHHVSSPSVLRALCWPLFMVGLLADELEVELLDELISSLEPRGIFRVVRKSLENAVLVRERNRDCASSSEDGTKSSEYGDDWHIGRADTICMLI